MSKRGGTKLGLLLQLAATQNTEAGKSQTHDREGGRFGLAPPRSYRS